MNEAKQQALATLQGLSSRITVITVFYGILKTVKVALKERAGNDCKKFMEKTAPPMVVLSERSAKAINNGVMREEDSRNAFLATLEAHEPQIVEAEVLAVKVLNDLSIGIKATSMEDVSTFTDKVTSAAKHAEAKTIDSKELKFLLSILEL